MFWQGGLIVWSAVRSAVRYIAQRTNRYICTPRVLVGSALFVQEGEGRVSDRVRGRIFRIHVSNFVVSVGLRAPSSSRSGRGWGFSELVKRTETPTEPSAKFDPRVPPSINPSTVKQVKKILAERNNCTPSRKVSIEEKVVEHPDGLLPIHLRSEPLAQLSPSDILFAKTNGASNIVRRRHKDLANHTFAFRDQPARKKNQFIDDAAIESDGEGGDVPSRASTPNHSRPPSPLQASNIPTVPLSVELPIKKTKVKKPKEYCKTCNRFFDGIKQLEGHNKSKKHLKQVRNSTSTNCKQCNRFFTSRHNFASHKCKSFLNK